MVAPPAFSRYLPERLHQTLEQQDSDYHQDDHHTTTTFAGFLFYALG